MPKSAIGRQAARWECGRRVDGGIRTVVKHQFERLEHHRRPWPLSVGDCLQNAYVAESPPVNGPSLGSALIAYREHGPPGLAGQAGGAAGAGRKLETRGCSALSALPRSRASLPGSGALHDLEGHPSLFLTMMTGGRKKWSIKDAFHMPLFSGSLPEVPFPASDSLSYPGRLPIIEYQAFPPPSPVAHVFSLWFLCRPKLLPGDARCSCGASLSVRATPASHLEGHGRSLSLAVGAPNGEKDNSPLAWLGECRVSVSPINWRWYPGQTKPTVTSPPHLAPRTSLIRPRPDRATSFLPLQCLVPAPSQRYPLTFAIWGFLPCISL